MSTVSKQIEDSLANLLELQPDFHPLKPIIVGLDDRLESPDTIALRLEEAQQGFLREDSSPRLFEMATYSKAAPLPSMNGWSKYADTGGDGVLTVQQATTP